MKILIMSDTHGYLDKAIEVIEKNSDIGMLIHLGDFFRDAEVLADIFPEVPIEYVYGNSDISVGSIPAEKILELMGKRIFITHGHRYSVTTNYEKLFEKVKEDKVDLVAFGHTHYADLFKKRKTIFINPGSLGSYSDTLECSYAVIDVGEKKIKAKVHKIK